MPSPLSAAFIGVTALDILFLILAANIRFSNSDAAGNAMSSGFQAAYVMVGAVAVGSIALLFTLIRYRPIRIGLIILQGIAAILIGGLLQ